MYKVLISIPNEYRQKAQAIRAMNSRNAMSDDFKAAIKAVIDKHYTTIPKKKRALIEEAFNLDDII